MPNLFFRHKSIGFRQRLVAIQRYYWLGGHNSSYFYGFGIQPSAQDLACLIRFRHDSNVFIIFFYQKRAYVFFVHEFGSFLNGGIWPNADYGSGHKTGYFRPGILVFYVPAGGVLCHK